MPICRQHFSRCWLDEYEITQSLELTDHVLQYSKTVQLKLLNLVLIINMLHTICLSCLNLSQ